MAGAIVLHYTDHPARPTHDVPGCRYFFEEGGVVFSIHLSQNFGQYISWKNVFRDKTQSKAKSA